MNNFANIRSLKQQTGATLFICLMLLLAISIISLAAMRTSLLELVIANNKQQFSNTFQAAEEVINNRLGDPEIVIDGSEVADQVIASAAKTHTIAHDGATIATATSNIIYRTKAPASGWELGSGVAYHFQIDVTATAVAKNAVSEHLAGFYIIAPSAE